MAGVKEESGGLNGQGYFVPASLMNKLILSCITGIVVIGGYMITWAINDTAWKTTQEARQHALQVQLDSLSKSIDVLPPPWLLQQVKDNAEGIRRLESTVNTHRLKEQHNTQP